MGNIGIERREIEFEPLAEPEPARHDDPPTPARREAPAPEPARQA